MDIRNALLLFCRAGFERECLSECQEAAQALDTPGRGEEGAGFVLFFPEDPREAGRLGERLLWSRLVFTRHLATVQGEPAPLPAGDRIRVLGEWAERIAAWTGPFSEVWLSTPDTNEGKRLWPLCRALEARLHQEWRQRQLLIPEQGGPRAELFFLEGGQVLVGHSAAHNGSPWPGGVPRFRFPADAPSRAVLKLEEAIHLFLPPFEREQRLAAGMKVVDLGAAPGGWTHYMARLGCRVTAVDNGRLDPKLTASPRVSHLAADGFVFKPERPVDWMLCDIADKPRRVAERVGVWGGKGWCREAIFNLKLPMKRRLEEVRLCREMIEAALQAVPRRFRLRFKQLYHDREEVTGHLVVGERG